MNRLARRRGALLAVTVASAALTVVAAYLVTTRYARDFAERSAVTIAGYLALVTPASKDRSDYDLPRLLVRARALETLPGWTPQVEVYHATAPLVHATGEPLATPELARLRREETVGWHGGAAIAPLLDRDEWDVVGAVSVRAPALGGAGLAAWALAALVVTLAMGARAVRPPLLPLSPGAGRALSGYGAAAFILALATYAQVRGAARRATDQWLTDTRMLVQEAAASPDRPALTDVARAARGGELVAGDSGAADPLRSRRGGLIRATLAVRLGPGHWAELRAPAAEAGTYGWLLLTLGLALLGPATVWLAAWGERTARHPRHVRETLAAWAFLAPSLCHLAVFSVVPLLLAIPLGVANVTRLARDPLVWTSLRTTALYVLYVPVTMALALAAALVWPRRSRWGRAAAALLLLPYASSVVATALVWEWLEDPWLSGRGTALVAVMLVSLVAQLGYQITLFQAGLAAIPAEYVDAARADGAGAWRRFWRVTFPLLRPVTLFVLVTGLAGASQVFTYVYVLTQGGPLYATDAIAYRVYEAGWGTLQFGYAAAIAGLLGLLLLPLMRAQFRLLASRVEHA